MLKNILLNCDFFVSYHVKKIYFITFSHVYLTISCMRIIMLNIFVVGSIILLKHLLLVWLCILAHSKITIHISAPFSKIVSLTFLFSIESIKCTFEIFIFFIFWWHDMCVSLQHVKVDISSIHSRPWAKKNF